MDGFRASTDSQSAQFQCGNGAQVHFDWGLGGVTELCSLGNNAQTSRQDWSSLDFSARRVAFASAPLFRKLQRDKQRGLAGQEALAKYARDISKALMADQFDLDNLKDESALQLFHEKAIWELLTILYVEDTDATSLAQALSDWLKKFHILYAASSDPPLLSEVQRLKASERPDQDHAYWPLLHRVAALGWIQETYDLLTSHSVFTTSYAEQQEDPNLRAEYDVADHLARLLSKMPAWQSPPAADEEGIGRSYDNRADFLAEREIWLSEIMEKLFNDPEPWKKADLHSETSADGLQQVVAILCGYPDQAREAAQSWLELLIAQLLHSYPALTVKAGLPSLLDQCISSMGSTESWQLSVAQQILEGVCDDEVQGIIQVCSERFSPWLLAHIPDLLFVRPSTKATLNRILPHLGCSQVEFYMLEYASALASGGTTWELAFDYYACSSHLGEPSAVALLESKMQTDDWQTVQKLLSICTKFGLSDVRAAILESQGQSCLQAGRLGEAFSCLLQLDNLAPANKAAATVLLASTHNSAFDSLGKTQKLEGLLPLLMTAVDSESKVKGPLYLLQAYLQFAKGMSDQKHLKLASDPFIRLLQSDYTSLTPLKQKRSGILLELLFQALPLLQCIPPVFSLSEASVIRQAQHNSNWLEASAAEQKLTSKRQAVCLAIEQLHVRVHLHQAD